MGVGGWPPGPPLPMLMQSTQYLLLFRYSRPQYIQREKERKRVNDENYHEKRERERERERERDAVHTDVQRDQK